MYQSYLWSYVKVKRLISSESSTFPNKRYLFIIVNIISKFNKRSLSNFIEKQLIDDIVFTKSIFSYLLNNSVY